MNIVSDKKSVLNFPKNLLLACLLGFFGVACESKNENNATSSFDRKEMLANYADNFIKPAFIDLQSKTAILQAAINTFATNPTLTTLTQTQAAWENAYLSFQAANAYNFGAAGEDGLRKSLLEEIAIFPISTEKIESNIAINNMLLNDFNRDNRGFLAIEYLLFDLQDNHTKIVNSFEAKNRKNYLIAVIDRIKNQIDAVVVSWNGNYRNEFVNNSGKEAGSSTSILYNEFVKNFEAVKNFKVGLPFGKRPGQTTIEPTKVEAYYSGKSMQMMKANFANIENIWYGKTKNGVQGKGFKQYLASVEGGEALVLATENQLRSVNAAFAAVPNTPRFSQQLTTNAPAIENLNTELQKLTRFFKSDMSSLLGISITFMSGDGD
jgi:predicted lipoprotein